MDGEFVIDVSFTVLQDSVKILFTEDVDDVLLELLESEYS